VERSVADGLAALDEYEAKFAAVLGEVKPARPTPADTWDARLASARGGAAEVDRLLAEAEAGWAKWRERFSAWRRGIEQPPGGPADGESRSDPAGGRAVEPVRRAGEEAVR
jgi:hypothetical protein